MYKPVFDQQYYFAENIQFDSIQPGSEFYHHMDKLLNIPYDDVPQQTGQAQSTVRFTRGLTSHAEFQKLWVILIPHLQYIADKMNRNVTNVRVGRAWANRLYQGCGGRIHHHSNKFKPFDLVAIFYYQAPENSGKFVFVNDAAGAKHADGLVEDVDNKDKLEVTVKTGTLLLHSPDIWHGITIHNSHIPRICIVLELSFY